MAITYVDGRTISKKDNLLNTNVKRGVDSTRVKMKNVKKVLELKCTSVVDYKLGGNEEIVIYKFKSGGEIEVVIKLKPKKQLFEQNQGA